MGITDPILSNKIWLSARVRNIRDSRFIKWALFACTLWACHPLYAQNKAPDSIETYLDWGYQLFYTQTDSAFYYFKRARENAEAYKDWEKAFEATALISSAAGYASDLKQLEKSIAYADSLLLKRKSYFDQLPDNHLLYLNLRYDKGNYWFKMGDYVKAKKEFEGIARWTEIQDPEDLGEDEYYYQYLAYSFLAKMLVNERKYLTAESYYRRNNALIRERLNADPDALYGNYALLAEALREQGDLNESTRYFRRVFTYDMLTGVNPNRIVSVATNLSQNYLQTSEIDSARYYLTRILPFINQDLNRYSFYYRTQAELLIREGYGDQAVALLEQIIEATNSGQLKGKEINLSGLYLQLGKTLLAQEKPFEALEAFDQGLVVNESAVHPYTLELIQNKVKVLNEIDRYPDALTASREGSNVLDSLKTSFLDRTDKITLIEKAFPMFEEALEAIFLEYQQTQDPELLEDAFLFMEKSKGVLLLDALLQSEASEFANVPSELLDSLEHLRRDIISLEKDYELDQEENRVNLGKTLFKKQRAHTKILEDIEANSPDFYALKFSNESVPLSDIIEGLASEEGLISYFFGEEHLYGISLSTSQIKFRRMELTDQLYSSLEQYYALLSNPDSDSKQLAALSEKLYSQLLQPLLVQGTRSLICIPDGLLNYIPLGTLNTAQDGIQYFIETHDISYAASATSLIRLKNKQHPKTNLLAIAPEFTIPDQLKTSEPVLGPLQHSLSEAKAISTIFPSVLLAGEQANYKNFQSQCQSHTMLHFATHSVLNDLQPEYSYLALAPDDTGQDRIYAKDLYALNLNNAFVTLSACETGIGKLRKGEGFLSLSQGFFYSGAISITSSLWKVNDASTAMLMQLYYEHLDRGLNKAAALQNAKQDFLLSYKGTPATHPYYWGAFTLHGDKKPLVNKFNWTFLLVGLLIFGAFLYPFRQKLLKLLK